MNSPEKGRPSEHLSVIASVKNYDNPWQVPRKQKGKWADGMELKTKGKVLYFAGCSTSLLLPVTATKAIRLIKAAGADPAYLGQKERCCGSTVRKLGEPDLARKKAEECFDDFRKAGASIVVTSCPGCSAELNHYPDLVAASGIKVMHISKFLDERLDKDLLGKVEGLGAVTFHDPCDLGRGQGIYDEPRRLIHCVTGEPVIEMERSREHGACCGSGGGVKSAYGGLAGAIGEARLSMAKSAGARTIVTSCPWCVQNLTECQKGRRIVDVLDLVELLDRSILEGGRGAKG